MGAENYAGLVNFGAFSLSETNPDRAVNQRKGSAFDRCEMSNLESASASATSAATFVTSIRQESSSIMAITAVMDAGAIYC
jgi:hypothetical protein